MNKKIIELVKEFNCESIFQSNINIYSFEYKKPDIQVAMKFFKKIMDLYQLNEKYIIYDLNYDGYEEFYPNHDLSVFTWYDNNSKYIKNKIFVSNINNTINFKINNTNYYLSEILKGSNREITSIVQDRLEMKFTDILLLNFENKFILYPNDEGWFGVIALNKEDNIFNNVIEISKEDKIDFFTNS